jgi:trypsin
MSDSIERMGGRFRLALIGTLAALTLVVPASAAAQSAQPRIVGGQGVSINQFPWQAALVLAPAKYPGNEFQRQICGGVLVTTRIVISAGHCVADTDPDCGGFVPSHSLPCTPLTDPGGDGTRKLDANDADIVLGGTNLQTNQGTELTLLNDPGAVSLHPGFNLSTLQHDVSYFVLGSAASPPAQTLLIAGSNEGSLWADGVFEDITGWGATAESGPGSGGSPTLMGGSVPIFNVNACANAYASVGDFVDPSTMVCAGYADGGVDSCFGDSGGPMQAPLQGGGYRLVGLTSWGEGCAEAGFPGVYTRVAEPAFTAQIQTKVSDLETAYGFAHENIVGSGAQPRGGGPTFPRPSSGGTSGQPAAQPTVAPTDPFAKCRRVRSKKKRVKCVKKVRAQLKARS